MADAIVQNVTLSYEIHQFQIRRAVSFTVRADHPAVQLLIREHLEQALALAQASGPSFGGITG